MLIPLTRAWKTQLSIDLFMDDFINNRRMIGGKPRYPGPTELRDFLNNLGTKDAIINFLCTPYHGHSRKIQEEKRGTPFQVIIENMSANYIHVLREVIGDKWKSLVDRHSRDGRFYLQLEGSNQTDRLNVLLDGLPETKRKNVVDDLLACAIRNNRVLSIPALRQAFLGEEEEVISAGRHLTGDSYEADLRVRRKDVTAKWAEALVKDRYIFTAISKDASCGTIEALLNGLTSAQYREVMMAVDPENRTDPIPLIMQVMLSENWGVKEAIAERFEESDWENLLTGYWSERFIKNVIEDKYADELLSFILENLSEDGILKVAQANDSLLLREIIFKEKPTLYASLLNSIEDEGKKEHARTLLGQFIKRIDTEHPITSTGLMVPAFLLRGAFTSAAQKIVESEGYKGLRCSYTCFEDPASPAP